MELREFAERVLLSPDWEAKVRPPEGGLTDHDPGPPAHVPLPARSADLAFSRRGGAVRMPAAGDFGREVARGLAHHIMLGHELQALEGMAWALLRFPEAPAAFRTGLAAIAVEEQRHSRWHADRAAELGVPLGSAPLAGLVWRRVAECRCPLEYLACLPLTFEAANLDHSAAFAARFAAVGDEAGRKLMADIAADEVRHVRFGMVWLRRLKDPAAGDFAAYAAALRWPTAPRQAVAGPPDLADWDARRRAGMGEDFLRGLRSSLVAGNLRKDTLTEDRIRQHGAGEADAPPVGQSGTAPPSDGQ